MKYYKTNNSIVFTKNNKYVVLTKTKNGVKITNVSDEDIDWITVRGNHIPVKKGQSKTDAIRDFIKSRKSDTGTGATEKGQEGNKRTIYGGRRDILSHLDTDLYDIHKEIKKLNISHPTYYLYENELRKMGWYKETLSKYKKYIEKYVDEMDRK